MADHKYFYNTFVMAVILHMILLILTDIMSGLWKSIHLLLLPIYLVLTGIAILGSAKKKVWSTKLFLVIFAIFSLDGLYIISVYKYGATYLLILLSVVGLYYTIRNINIYCKRINLRVIDEEVRALEKADKLVREAIKSQHKSHLSEESKPIKKKSSKKKAAKKTTKKTTKNKVVKKAVKKVAKKAATKKQTSKKTSKKAPIEAAK